MTTKVQAENAKIQEAMKARRAEAQRRRRAAAKVAAEQKDVNARLGIPTSENGVRVEAGKAAVLEGIRGILAGTTTADEVLASPAVAALILLGYANVVRLPMIGRDEKEDDKP